MRKTLIAGNWKMNKTFDEAVALARGIAECAADTQTVDIAVFPPTTYIRTVAEILYRTQILVGAQNIHNENEGAFTAEISAKMVLTCGADMVILGHSERRHIFAESDELICSKLKQALSSGLTPVLCIGEQLEERDSGRTEGVLQEQLSGSLRDIPLSFPEELILAYEPVWAIGTGRVAGPNQAQEVHLFIRNWIRNRYGGLADGLLILYGGSVKPGNATDLLVQPDIDGALVGGASLKKESFCEIIAAAQRAV